MADLPDVPDAVSRAITDPVDAAQVVLANRGAPASPTHGLSDDEVLQVLEETLTVSTRRRSTGTLRLSTLTEVVQETSEVEVDRYRVEVTRVPVCRVVEEPPVARAQGDTTIIPVVEERLVVVKQLFLIEEVHIRHVVERETVAQPVTLRRQHVRVEHLDPPDRMTRDATTTEASLPVCMDGVEHWSKAP